MTTYYADADKAMAYDELSLFVPCLMDSEGQPVAIENVQPGDILGMVPTVPVPGCRALFFPVDFCEKTPVGLFVHFSGWGREAVYTETEESD
jgi:hypothetical protein